MAALSAPAFRRFEGQQEEISPKVKTNQTYYLGAVLTYDSNGFAAAPSNGATQFGAGVVIGQYEGGVMEKIYVVPNGPTPRAVLRRGKVWLPLTSAEQTDVGEYAYIEDTGGLTQTAGAKTVKYLILDVDAAAGLVLVDLRAAFEDIST